VQIPNGCSRAASADPIAAAQRAGARFGRPPSIDDARWAKAQEYLEADPPARINDIAGLIGVRGQAIYRRIERDKALAASLSHMLTE
jgi:hypothetical protein